MNALSDFAKGDRVILSRVQRDYAKGRTGTVVRIVKSRKCVTVDLDHSESGINGYYDAYPQNIDKVSP